MMRLRLRTLVVWLLLGLNQASAPTPDRPSSPNLNLIQVASSLPSIFFSMSSSTATRLEQAGFKLGNPVFIRIFKQERILELWMRANDGRYHLFQHYPICNFSGSLGPKLREGDRQSPEGFYTVGLNQLNPNSRYHRAFDLGFPNAYDRVHRRTGSALMVHGSCVSTGCYAMTDRQISEIYTLVEAALRGGQPFFHVHAFPFRMTDTNLTQYSQSQWYNYWLNLKQGYDYFEYHHLPPAIQVSKQRYYFQHSSELKRLTISGD